MKVPAINRSSVDERQPSIQLGVADPDLPYAERPVEAISISQATAYSLIGQLAAALNEGDHAPAIG